MSWYEPPPPPAPSGEEIAALCELLRASLRDHLLGRPGRALPSSPAVPGGENLLAERCGLFVTLRLAGALRGCMGVVEATEPLVASVPRLARVAAGADPRFPPLSASELDGLSVELTLLGPPVDPGCRGGELERGLQPGVHGARLRFGPRTGLLLPQVALDWGWGAGEFLDRVAEKAGLAAAAWRDGSAEVVLFRAVSFEVVHP